MFGFDINFWLILGFFGQFLFFMRFFVQWIASEKRRESFFPVAFWYFSIGGGVILLIYAVSIKDPVFILGQGAGLLIYIRNLVLIRKKNILNKSHAPQI
ncbi:MAG: lipid-A-disaccharide synthase N-terminal domain-containing protein [Candidatus Niyogibacteria bacterium]|nr:lipid-A-disaccharide synthase N-terminal domain-containing protein [Candidatus Niyogibacteria bacterium]